MMEHEVSPPKGARRARKRVGRGDAAGGGSYAGRGLKGQKSRSGPGVRPGFEGGQMPLIKGLPMKRGFNNRYKTYYALVDLETLQERFEANTRVTPKCCIAWASSGARAGRSRWWATANWTVR